jgi:hypothetical protein
MIELGVGKGKETSKGVPLIRALMDFRGEDGVRVHFAGTFYAPPLPLSLYCQAAGSPSIALTLSTFGFVSKVRD